MPPIISFENLSKHFGKNIVIENANLDIHKSELFGILGRSGSGKSTLLKILTGFYKPSDGKIYFNGEDVTKNTKELKKSIGFATQEDAFYYDLTVHENMKYYCRIYGLSGRIDEYVTGLLRSVELDGYEDYTAGKLSGGMKRRLDIAISIVHDPEIVVMDEPTSNLDPLLRREIWKTILGIKSMGKTVIVASHMFDEISMNCDRACIITDTSINNIFDLNEIRKNTNTADISAEMEKYM